MLHVIDSYPDADYPVTDADAVIFYMLMLVCFNTDYVDNEVFPRTAYISYSARQDLQNMLWMIEYCKEL